MTKYITISAPENIESYFSLFMEDNNAFVAGGALRGVFETAAHQIRNQKKNSISDFVKHIEKSAFLNEMKDIDLFFRSKEDFENALNSFKNQAETEVHYETSNSVGLSISWDTPVLDLVRRQFGTVEKTLDSFDFTVSQCALYQDNGKYFLIFSEEFLEDVFEQKLRHSQMIRSNEISAYSPLERTMRHIDYGYMADEKTVQKTYQSAIENYPEFKEIKSEEKLLETMFSSKFSSHKGLRKIMSSVHYKKNSSGGSFISGYALERESIRCLIQEITNPDFDGDDYIQEYGQKYGSYRLPRNYKKIGLTTVNLLKLLESKESLIGKNNVKILTHFLFSYNFAIDGSFASVRCNVCRQSFGNCSYSEILMSGDRSRASKGHSAIYRIDDFWMLDGSEAVETEPRSIDLKIFSENSIEVVYKAFMLNKDDDKWVLDTVDFFIDYASSADDTKISLKQWHNFIDDGFFDPSLPPSLLLSLVG